MYYICSTLFPARETILLEAIFDDHVRSGEDDDRLSKSIDGDEKVDNLIGGVGLAA